MVIVSSCLADLGWVHKSLKVLFDAQIDQRFAILVIRIAWAATAIQYQFLGLFIESLAERNYRFPLRQKLFFITTFCLAAPLLYLAFAGINTPSIRPAYEFRIMMWITLYINIVMLPSLYLTIKKLRIGRLPKIIKNQLKLLIYALITPLLLAEFFQNDSFSFSASYVYQIGSRAIVSISLIILTFAIYLISKKLVGMRFLNLENHVQSPSSDKSNFIDYFKDILEQLGYLTTAKELEHITQIFFKDTLRIPFNTTHLYLYPSENMQQISFKQKYENQFSEALVEQFLNNELGSIEINEYLQKTKILIKDEIDFNNFYQETDVSTGTIKFLETLNADIFLPIYNKQNLIAYIIIETNARTDSKLYSKVERDEMVVFASYLGNVINLLQNKNIYSLIQKDKELKEELYNKHQEINQYKESIRSFLQNSKDHEIGVLFYKNRHFTFCNQTAKQYITINPNTQEGHYLTKDLRKIAQQVEAYKSAQKLITFDTQGNKLILYAINNLEHNNVIIFVYYPEISDLLKKQIENLKNPSQWDYVLYLETTESGKLINQLIPGNGPMLLDFKINLLKIALSKKALLLDLPDQDLLATVKIIHHIRLRENLEIISLNADSDKSYEIAIKLFGINALFGSINEAPLLEKYNKTGTIFIENVHHLSLETQQSLVDFIRYGFYRVFKSDIKVWSDAHIICSSNQNLKMLAQEGKFSEGLYNELGKTTLSMPSLLELPDKELDELADGFTQQAIKTKDLKDFLILTEKEKNKFIQTRPVSLFECKEKIHAALVNKSKKNDVFEETEFDPAYHISDPELVQAARLGKHALRDQKIMRLLWDKFKSQSKIAQFLGVNRSSVNRRCKEFNLI